MNSSAINPATDDINFSESSLSPHRQGGKLGTIAERSYESSSKPSQSDSLEFESLNQDIK